jgi:hypothetical protein
VNAIPIKVSNKDTPSFITYEAEKAFRNVKGDVSACNMSMSFLSLFNSILIIYFIIFCIKMMGLYYLRVSASVFFD